MWDFVSLTVISTEEKPRSGHYKLIIFTRFISLPNYMCTYAKVFAWPMFVISAQNWTISFVSHITTALVQLRFRQSCKKSFLAVYIIWTDRRLTDPFIYIAIACGRGEIQKKFSFINLYFVKHLPTHFHNSVIRHHTTHKNTLDTDTWNRYNIKRMFCTASIQFINYHTF